VLGPGNSPLELMAVVMMKNNYRGTISALLEQTHPQLSTTNKLEFKSVFGAVGGYVDGKIFVSCGSFGVALRLPPNILESLFKEEGVERLRYFPKGHIKKEYAVLPPRVLEDQHRFKELVDESITYVCA
jgi:TfoX/Sxy family transcriptional regulator of competence genes